MRINRRELLVFIAIVTSAIVYQIRQHGSSEPVRATGGQRICDARVAHPDRVSPAMCSKFRGGKPPVTRAAWV